MRRHAWYADRLPRSDLRAYLALVSVCIFWGTTYVAIRIALESVPPFWLVASRFLISGGLMCGFLWWRGEPFPTGRDAWWTALYGVMILGIGNGALTLSETYIASGLAGLFITLSPFWMISIEAILPGGEKIHVPTLAGMMVGLAGTAFLVSRGLANSAFGSSVIKGFFVLQCGMACWSFGSIAQRRLKLRQSPVAAGALHQIAAGLAFLPVALLTPSEPVRWTWHGAGAVLYLVVFGSILGYTSYAYALSHLPVAVVSIHNYVNCAVAVLLGWLIYREPFGLREVAAMLVIFSGVAIVKKTSS